MSNAQPLKMSDRKIAEQGFLNAMKTGKLTEVTAFLKAQENRDFAEQMSGFDMEEARHRGDAGAARAQTPARPDLDEEKKRAARRDVIAARVREEAAKGTRELTHTVFRDKPDSVKTSTKNAWEILESVGNKPAVTAMVRFLVDSKVPVSAALRAIAFDAGKDSKAADKDSKAGTWDVFKHIEDKDDARTLMRFLMSNEVGVPSPLRTAVLASDEEPAKNAWTLLERLEDRSEVPALARLLVDNRVIVPAESRDALKDISQAATIGAFHDAVIALDAPRVQELLHVAELSGLDRKTILRSENPATGDTAADEFAAARAALDAAVERRPDAPSKRSPLNIDGDILSLSLQLDGVPLKNDRPAPAAQAAASWARAARRDDESPEFELARRNLFEAIGSGNAAYVDIALNTARSFEVEPETLLRAKDPATGETAWFALARAAGETRPQSLAPDALSDIEKIGGLLFRAGVPIRTPNANGLQAIQVAEDHVAAGRVDPGATASTSLRVLTFAEDFGAGREALNKAEVLDRTTRKLVPGRVRDPQSLTPAFDRASGVALEVARAEYIAAVNRVDAHKLDDIVARAKAAKIDKLEVAKAVDADGNNGFHLQAQTWRDGVGLIANTMREHGVPLNAPNAKGEYPLRVAAARNNVPAVKAYLALGAEAGPRPANMLDLIEGAERSNFSAIRHAITVGLTERAKEYSRKDMQRLIAVAEDRKMPALAASLSDMLQKNPERYPEVAEASAPASRPPSAPGVRAASVVLALFLLLHPQAGFAEMHHYQVAKPESGAAAKSAKPDAGPVSKNDAEAAAEKNDAEPASGDAPVPALHHGSFSITPVQECFEKLGPGEASTVRRDFENPWMECQRRLKERAEKAKDNKTQDNAAKKPSAAPVPANSGPSAHPAEK
jgi:hypothetical protein